MVAAPTKRVFGIETEYGISCLVPGQRNLPADELARYLFSDLVEKHRTNNVFLPNGGRLYLDVGSHPEYATAECNQIQDVIAQELAGDLLMQDMARRAEEQLNLEGRPAKVFVFKNNTDSIGNSFGCHENYSIKRRADQLNQLDGLLPFLATRQIFLGAGKLLKTSAGIQYVISQRADHLWDSISSATTRSRPIINTRDEPHADSSQYRRLHVISADSNRSQIQMLLKIASMDLLLALFELGGLPARLRIVNPMRVIRDVSRDLEITGKLELEDGTTISTLDLQAWYLELITANLSRFEFAPSGLHVQAIEIWSRLLSDFAIGNFEFADSVLDWRIKYQLLSKYAQAKDLHWDDPELVQIDFKYHDLNHGLFEILRSEFGIPEVVSRSDAESAKLTPPQTTRAKLRGYFIEQAERAGQSIAVDWMHLKVLGPEERSLSLGEPNVFEDYRISKLLKPN